MTTFSGFKLASFPSRRLAKSNGLAVLVLVPGLLLLTGSVQAQLKTKVAVAPAETKAIIYTTSFGVVAERWDKMAYDADTMKLLQDAGITNMRLPGGGGIDALCHWSTGTVANPGL